MLATAGVNRNTNSKIQITNTKITNTNNKYKNNKYTNEVLKPAAVPMLAAAGVDIGGGLVERHNAQAVNMKRCTNSRTNTNTQIQI